MPRFMICGINTDIGKTVASAILTTIFKGDYWKPIQSGDETQSDTFKMKELLSSAHTIFPPAYSFKAPLSPHHAAALENVNMDFSSIRLPHTKRPLIIEGVGGILVPLTNSTTSFDLFKTWDCQWIIVAKNYLGSINHTLLTIDFLQRQNITIKGIIFNGEANLYSEKAIFEITKLPFLARILPEPYINHHTIQRYSQQWHPQLFHLF
jgi:dethiobiotin synthetase